MQKIVKVKASKRGGKVVKAHTRKITVMDAFGIAYNKPKKYKAALEEIGNLIGEQGRAKDPGKFFDYTGASSVGKKGAAILKKHGLYDQKLHKKK